MGRAGYSRVVATAAAADADDDDKPSLDGSVGDCEDDNVQHAPLAVSRTGALVETASPAHRPRPPPRKPDAASVVTEKPVNSGLVAWRDLPNKSQLAVLTLTRLSEPLVQTSLQSYMFYQLQWFDATLPAAAVARQAGVLHAGFTAAQFFTAVAWGRVADAPWAGRKMVIMIGLAGTLVSCLGFGFATSFYQALFFRCLGGVTNGNVGVMRTMISEIVREKKYQSRAFLILPMTFNIGTITGPVIGGFLADPARSYPLLFGTTTLFVRFPYALPNLVSAAFLGGALVFVWLFLDETLDTLRPYPDTGRRLGARLSRLLLPWTRDAILYTPLHPRHCSVELESDTPRPRPRPVPKQRLPFRRIFTRNVLCTLVAHFLLALHLGAFSALTFVYLSTPVYDPATFAPAPPFHVSGGLGLPAPAVGLAMALIGTLGIAMQLLLYPWLTTRLGSEGTISSWRFGLALFPPAYALLPLLTLTPSTTPPPGPKTGAAAWAALAGVLALAVAGRTFALPAQAILVNNCAPHPSVLGTIHGLGQSVSSLARTLGPAAAGAAYGWGLTTGLVGAVFWVMVAVAVAGFAASFPCCEGDGHEIHLAGDDEAEEDK